MSRAQTNTPLPLTTPSEKFIERVKIILLCPLMRVLSLRFWISQRQGTKWYNRTMCEFRLYGARLIGPEAGIPVFLWRLVSEVFGKCNGSGLESTGAGWENVKVTKPPGPSPSLCLPVSGFLWRFSFTDLFSDGAAGVWGGGTLSLNRLINVVVLKNVTTFNQDF